MRPTEKITMTSGLSWMPFVSSSKNRSSPALAAGIGAPVSRLFFLLKVIHLCTYIDMSTNLLDY
jgi:hypothetical protein